MSNVIKFEYTYSDIPQKVIGVKQLKGHQPDVDEFQKKTQTPQKRAEETLEMAEKSLQQANIDAEQIRNEAQAYYDRQVQKVEALKQQWTEEKAKLKEETEARAYEDGFQNGHQDAMKEYESFIAEAKNVLSTAKEEQLKLVRQSEQIILQLAMRAAEKIVKESLSENANHYLKMVKAVLNETKDHKDIQLKVDPFHYEYVMKWKEELEKVITTDATIIIYPEEELRDGGCIIESSFGRIDAGVDSQLNEIKQKLTVLLEEEHDEGS